MSLDLLDYWEDDEIRARMLDALSCYADTLPPAPTFTPPPSSVSSASIAPPQPISTASSIAPSKSEPDITHQGPQLHPELEPPKVAYIFNRNVMYDLLDLHFKTEDQASISTKIFKRQIDQEMADIEQLHIENQKALEKHAKEIKVKNTWGIFAKIAQYIASAATIVLGIACIASGVGAAPGALLIASGGLNLLNRVMSDTGAWLAVTEWFAKSEELQRKIAQRIDIGMFFLSMGLAIGGGIWAWQSGAIAAIKAAGTQAVAAKAAQIVTLSGGIVGTSSRLGEASTEKRVKYIEALMTENDGRITIDYEMVTENTKKVEKMIETSISVGKTLQDAINSLRLNL